MTVERNADEPVAGESSAGLPAWARVAVVAVPLVVVAAIVGLGLGGTDRSASSSPDSVPSVVDRTVPVTSDAVRFDSLDELVAASDVIVLAEAISESPGRTVVDPLRPAVGVETRLVALRVVEVVVGDATVGDVVTLEEPAALLDGTPVLLDGVAPVDVGRRGVFFLVRSPDPGVPYLDLVGPQGRFLVDGDRLVGAVADPLVERLVAGGGPALVDAIRAG